MKKLFNLIVTLLLTTMLVATSSTAAQVLDSCAIDPSIVIDEVQVEGVENPTLVNIERGDKVSIRVELYSNCDLDDVKVKSWIGGYEYDDIEDTTSLFNMKQDVRYVKNLVLEIPNDINANDQYTLHVEAFNDDVNEELEFSVEISAKRHLLNFVDVIFNPGLSAKNTQPLFVTVRLENLGDEKEDDVRVEVSIPELGMSQRTFIDELVTVEDSDNNDEETSQSSDTLLIDLSDVQPGTYNLRIKVDYNRGHDSVVQNYPLTVTGGASAAGTSNLMVQANTASMDVNQGGSAVYTFSIANLGTQARTFNFELSGQEAWATARLDPMAVTVLPGATREVNVVVNAKADADLGSKVFTVRVKEGSSIAKELQFDANVKPESAGNMSSLRSGLEIGFIVLLVILVILGIILAVNKLKGKEESGESYY